MLKLLVVAVVFVYIASAAPPLSKSEPKKDPKKGWEPRPEPEPEPTAWEHPHDRHNHSDPQKYKGGPKFFGPPPPPYGRPGSFGPGGHENHDSEKAGGQGKPSQGDQGGHSQHAPGGQQRPGGPNGPKTGIGGPGGHENHASEEVGGQGDQGGHSQHAPGGQQRPGGPNGPKTGIGGPGKTGEGGQGSVEPWGGDSKPVAAPGEGGLKENKEGGLGSSPVDTVPVIPEDGQSSDVIGGSVPIEGVVGENSGSPSEVSGAGSLDVRAGVP